MAAIFLLLACGGEAATDPVPDTVPANIEAASEISQTASVGTPVSAPPAVSV